MEFYRAVRHQPVRRSFAYLARFYALLAILGALVFVPGVFAARAALVEHLQARLPDGARFALAKGEFSTNVEMPFDIGTEDAPILIDTSIKGLDAPKDTPHVMVIGANAAFFPDDEDDGLQGVPLSDLPDFSVTKDGLVSWLDGLGAPLIAIGALAFVALWFLGMGIGAVMYVLVMSSAAWVAGKLAKTPLRYSQWVATGLHAVTLPTLATALFGSAFGRVPFLSTAIYAMFMVAVIADERANPSMPMPAVPVAPEHGPEKPPEKPEEKPEEKP